MREPMLSITETAAYLKLAPVTIRTWLREGKLPYYKVGLHVYCRQADLDRLVDAGRIQKPPKQKAVLQPAE